MASMRSSQGLPPSQTQLVPASFETEPLLDANSKGDDGTSVKTYLRKSRKCYMAAMREKKKKKCEINSSADTRVGRKGEKDVLQAL